MDNTYALSRQSETGEELLYMEYHEETRTDRAKIAFSYSGPDASVKGSDINTQGYFVNSGVIIINVMHGKTQGLVSDFDCGRLHEMCVNARGNLPEKWHNVLGGWILEERM